MVKQIIFKLAWGDLETKNCFQRCLENFVLLFMLWLKAAIDKNSHIEAGIYFIFLQNLVKQTPKSFSSKFLPQWKDRKSSYKVRQISVLFCNLFVLILGYNCVKGIRVTKIVKKNMFKEVWGELQTKNCFQRCLENFLLFFMFWLTAPIDKNSHI